MENWNRCRIVKLVDLDEDGRMDKSTTYLDNLVLPRAILTLDNEVLVASHPIYGCAKTPMGTGLIRKSVFLRILANGSPVMWNTKLMDCSGLWTTGSTTLRVHPFFDTVMVQLKREERSFLDNGAKP